MYDSQTQAAKQTDVIGLIEHTLAGHCSLELRSVVGFDSRNRVVLKMGDARDEEGHAGDCIHGTADWLYDPVMGSSIPSAAQQ